MTNNVWYYQWDGETFGPVTGDVVRQIAKAETLVRRGETEPWGPFGQSELVNPAAKLSPPGAPIEAAQPAAAMPAQNGDPSAPSDHSRATSACTSADQPGNYLIRHWRGNLTVARSYWLNTFLVNAGISLFIRPALDTFIPELLDLRIRAWLFFGLVAGILLLSTWQLVGLVRSSRKSPSKDAKIWGFIGAALLLGGLLFSSTRTIIPYGREMVSILSGDRSIPRMKLDVHPNGREIEIRGGIPAGSAERFVDLLAQHPDATVVHVNSSGGRARDALVIAHAIQARGMVTVVDTQCASAATVILLAGRERYALRTATVGFHQAGVRGLPGADNAVSKTNDAMAGYMAARGTDKKFIERVLGTKHADMWYPSFQEMVDARVLTGLAAGTEFSASRSFAEGSLDQLKAMLSAEEIFRLLSARAPAAYDEAVVAAQANMVRGDSFMGALQPLRLLLHAEFNRTLPEASDEGIDAMIDLLVLVCERFGATHPDEVTALFEGRSDINNDLTRLPNYPAAEELSTMVKVMSAAKPGLPVASPAEVEALSAKVVAYLQANDAATFELLLEGLKSGSQSPSAMLALLKGMRDGLTQSERARFLRATMSGR